MLATTEKEAISSYGCMTSPRKSMEKMLIILSRLNIFTGIKLDKWYIHNTSLDTLINKGKTVIAVIITRTVNGDLNIDDNTIVNADDNIFPNKTKTKYNTVTFPIVNGTIDNGK